MTFEPETPKTPTSIGDLSVVLTDYIDAETTSTVSYEVQLLQVDGSIFKLASGDLVPHLSAEQVSGLLALMADLRTKAQALIPA